MYIGFNIYSTWLGIAREGRHFIAEEIVEEGRYLLIARFYIISINATVNDTVGNTKCGKTLQNA